MYLRPTRMRTGLAFLGGLTVSVILLAAGTWYVLKNEDAREKRSYEKARILVEEEWEASHPMEPVYAFVRDITAGTVIGEADLVLRESLPELIPSDAVSEPAKAIGLVARTDLKQNSLCVQSLLFAEDEYPDDARLQEYTAIRLPSRLEKGQCVDVRVMFPNGLDYVVLAKKAVRDLERGENGNGARIWMQADEEELLRMSSVMVDAALHPGTSLYAVTYVAPDIQAAAICTYPANSYVQDLIQANPNIVHQAVSELERTTRQWFDTIPDPQPQQPLAILPAPNRLHASGSMETGGVSERDANPQVPVPAKPSTSATAGAEAMPAKPSTSATAGAEAAEGL